VHGGVILRPHRRLTGFGLLAGDGVDTGVLGRLRRVSRLLALRLRAALAALAHQLQITGD